MPVFQNAEGKLKKLNIKVLGKERFLQKLIEDNLLEVFDMNFLHSEYPTTDRGRIDTLAIDADGTPVIIEYKRNRSDNVINQALSYFKWLKSQKVEFFERIVIKKLGEEKAKRIQWNNIRILCIAESYSKFDIDTLEVISLNLELYKYHYYDGDIFSIERVNSEDEKPSQIDKPEVDNEIVKPERIIIETNLQTHLNKGEPWVQDLFFKLQSRIFELDENVQEKITGPYIGYRASKMFVEVHIQKKKLLLYLRPIEYNDPEGRVSKVPDNYNWVLDRRNYINNEADLNYSMNLIEQSYKDIL